MPAKFCENNAHEHFLTDMCQSLEMATDSSMLDTSKANDPGESGPIVLALILLLVRVYSRILLKGGQITFREIFFKGGKYSCGF